MTEVHADSLDQLRARTSEKWLAYPADVLPLFVAEMDYPLAPVVADAMVDRIRASDTGYVSSSLGVGTAFAGFASRRWGWDVDPAAVMTTTDEVRAHVRDPLADLRAVMRGEQLPHTKRHGDGRRVEFQDRTKVVVDLASPARGP